MKLSSSIPAAATAFNTTLSAAENCLSILSLQRINQTLAPRRTTVKSMVTSDANLQAKPSVRAGVQTVEITFVADPQVLVRRTVNSVAPGPLRDFLRSELAERDVNQVLTTVRDDACPFQRLQIDRLRAAAETASYQSLQGPRARDTLHAAVVIDGIEFLLGETVESPYTSGAVNRSVVRDAKRALDSQDADQAHTLRNCLGWGNEDESYNARTAGPPVPGDCRRAEPAQLPGPG
jgi:hypothetical protein